MATIRCSYITGQTVKAIFFNRAGQALVASSGTFQTYSQGSVANYQVTATELGTSAIYAVTIPTIGSLPVDLEVYFYETVSGLIVAQGELGLDASGNVVNLPTLANQTSLLGRLNAAVVEVASPVASDQSIELVKGDSYQSADGRALSWSVANWSGPAVGGLSVEFRLMPKAEYDADNGSADLTVSGSVADDDGTAVFTVELSAAQTDALDSYPPASSKYNYVYQLVATDGGTYTQTIALGPCTVKRKAQ